MSVAMQADMQVVAPVAMPAEQVAEKPRGYTGLFSFSPLFRQIRDAARANDMEEVRRLVTSHALTGNDHHVLMCMDVSPEMLEYFASLPGPFGPSEVEYQKMAQAVQNNDVEYVRAHIGEYNNMGKRHLIGHSWRCGTDVIPAEVVRQDAVQRGQTRMGYASI